MKVQLERSRISLEVMKPFGRIGKNLRYLSVLTLVLLVAGASGLPVTGTAQRHGAPPKSHVGRVQTGLDILEAEKFAPLRGKHVGLITNHTGVDFQGRTNIELLARASGVQLVA